MHLTPDQSMQGSHNSQFCGMWFVGLRKTQVENITMAKICEKKNSSLALDLETKQTRYGLSPMNFLKGFKFLTK